MRFFIFAPKPREAAPRARFRDSDHYHAIPHRLIEKRSPTARSQQGFQSMPKNLVCFSTQKTGKNDQEMPSLNY